MKNILTIISGTTLLLAFVLGFSTAPEIIIQSLYLVSVISGGYFVFVSALRGLLRQRFLNINFLVVVAAIGAIYIKQLPEAAAVVFFFSLAEVFEEFGIERSRKAVESLVKKSPQTAILKNGQKVRVEEVKIKDVILVRPGDLIPLDGVVIKGFSSVDETTITGEAVPKDKQKDDFVFAGTLNKNGYLEIEITKESKDSIFSKIIKMVEQAQRSRAPYQEFIDRFAKYYTPTIVAGALLISVVPPFFFGGIFNEWLYRALVLLVIACPCALVISTPVSIASAIGGASRKGILIKGGKYIEALGKLRAIAFDKTKTLTLGEPKVSDVIAFNGYSEEEVFADAAGIEKFSSHPLSKAILEFVQERGTTPHVMEQYENIAGKGGEAVCLVCNDLEHCVGNLKLIGANAATSQEILEKTEKFEKEGKTVVLISEGNKVMGAFAITDTIRPESKETIEKLRRFKIETIMLTGDNPHNANFVAKEIGIKEAFASLLPEEKAQKIEEFRQKYGFVAMVGDGVNDAPSLVGSTVGIAMGVGGSDTAIETADVALMNSNLLNIPYAISLGRKTLKIIKQNIVASLGVKAVFLILALLGFTHLEYAIGADSGMALLVILNGLRLFRF